MSAVLDDLKAVKKRDPACRSTLQAALLYSGFHALFWYRIAHVLHTHHCYFLARFISQTTRFFTGIEIHPGATIGGGTFIDHGSGVVIGETAELGRDCTLYQGVTLGGTGKHVGKRHPTLGDHVLVGCGAKVLGPLKIGDNAKIAAGAVVLHDIPANSTAVGVPARVVRINNKKVESPENELDHVHIPDPITNDILLLALRVDQLQKELDDLKGNAAHNTTHAAQEIREMKSAAGSGC